MLYTLRNWLAYQQERQLILSTLDARVQYIRDELNASLSSLGSSIASSDETCDSLLIDLNHHASVQRLKTQLQFETLKLQRLESDYLLRKAASLVFPIPPTSDVASWVSCPDNTLLSYSLILSVDGITQLRSSLRKEEKERFETYQSRLAFLFAAIGVVIGLLSLTIALSK